MRRLHAYLPRGISRARTAPSLKRLSTIVPSSSKSETVPDPSANGGGDNALLATLQRMERELQALRMQQETHAATFQRYLDAEGYGFLIAIGGVAAGIAIVVFAT
jgi:hypothetical protein